ncbi:NAD-dependent epimerase/dehydratase family protein [Micromonospora sp. NPDC005171]|uniref:NAD-dependent epimerase/dehydratase family protein n=1 Tax=Micromonospora sp. NPDC005171 TaxID=3156866 RepID=UPI00339DC8C3
MAKHRVLVTGATGFIGRYVTQELNSRGLRVIGLDRHRSAEAFHQEAEVILGDVRDPSAVTEAMGQVDSWVHLAGVLGTQETITNPVPAAETNVIGGLNVLQAAAQYHLPGVNISVGNWFEDNTYSLTKHCIERFCSMYRQYRSLPVSVVRGFNAYGPGQSVAAPYGPSKVRKIVPSFVSRALNGDVIEIYGDGKQVMDMIYVSDLAFVIAEALEFTIGGGRPSGAFEAGTGRRTTVLDIAHKVTELMGAGKVMHLPLRPGESPGATVLADTSTLEPLGIDARSFVPLEDGLRKTIDYYAARA